MLLFLKSYFSQRTAKRCQQPSYPFYLAWQDTLWSFLPFDSRCKATRLQLFAMLPHAKGETCHLQVFQLAPWQGGNPLCFRTEATSPLVLACRQGTGSPRAKQGLRCEERAGAWLKFAECSTHPIGCARAVPGLGAELQAQLLREQLTERAWGEAASVHVPRQGRSCSTVSCSTRTGHR